MPKLSQIEKIKSLVRRLKNGHQRELAIADRKLKLLNKELDKSRAKHRELQKKHQKLHVTCTRQRRKIEIHEMTLKAIGNSLAIEAECPSGFVHAATKNLEN